MTQIQQRAFDRKHTPRARNLSLTTGVWIAGRRVAAIASMATRGECVVWPGSAPTAHCDVRSELLAINIVRIEVASNPFLEFSVSLMSGIADRIEEFGIAPGAATIFGRTAASRCDQARIEFASPNFPLSKSIKPWT